MALSSEIHWFDNHCHLDLDEHLRSEGSDAEQASERPMLVERARQQAQSFLDDARTQNVIGMNLVGVDEFTSRLYEQVAEQIDGVWSTAGVHPHVASQGTEGLRAFLKERRDSKSIVAIGECGLDYYYNHSDRASQRRAFGEQIDMAHDLGVPLVIHTRDAWDETFEVLDAHGTPRNTVFHCFTGGPAEAERCLERGAYISVSGIVTFKSATELQEAVRRTPLDRMMIETDSPYLAPVPHRGRPNRPIHVGLVGQRISELHGCDPLIVSQATTTNALSFYGIESSGIL